ncbi:MAG TPA: diguanylate cyclase, partial [Solirubrobacteraceae bacterium]
MSNADRHQDRWVVRASLAGLLIVLCFLAAFSVVTERGVAAKSARADRATRLSATYQDARHWVSEQKSIERQYRIEGSYVVRATHDQAEKRLVADLDRLLALDDSSATQAIVAQLRRLEADYRSGALALFDAVDAGDQDRVEYFDHSVIDPVFGVLADVVSRQAAAASAAALRQSAALRADEARANRTVSIAVALGLLLLALFAGIVVRYGRRLDAARAAEVERLAEIAITDPLTGLRNHRAFQEDIGRELQRVARTGIPVALAIVDVDELKAVNDSQGHQAGDERLQALADAIRATGRAADAAYRIGGDEFAVILPDARAWGALEFVQRLRAATQTGAGFTVTAGISEAVALRSKDDLIREADLALLGAKRTHQDAAIFGPDMAPDAAAPAGDDEHHTRTLSSALARAVDAKDSYTRSHCQTVSQLCGLIGTELGFEGERLTRLRLAGLLHDVGKIGVPDAILNKPAKLTDDEYELMKRHSLLGYDIVQAADMELEARWVRHHHERYDGRGYPDGLAGDEIPLEARIIHVADAYDSMRTNRVYQRTRT